MKILKKRRTKFEKSMKFIAQTNFVKKDFFTICKLKNRTIFEKNIALFFEDFKNSTLNSKSIKTRKKLTRKKCQRISNLNFNSIIF